MRRAPTPPERFVDAKGRPYFLWDVDLTLDQYRDKLASKDPAEAAYWLARALRDAKPDDVLEFVSWATLASMWPRAARMVGRRREFWIWWLRQMGSEVDATITGGYFEFTPRGAGYPEVVYHNVGDSGEYDVWLPTGDYSVRFSADRSGCDATEFTGDRPCASQLVRRCEP